MEIWETKDSNRPCLRKERRDNSNNPIMDGNTTRINRILRRSIRLPIPTHNSRLARSNRQRIPRQALIRLGRRNHFRRASSSL